MDATLDTDILIHLYKAEEEAMIFKVFDTVYLYGYLYHQELYKKAPDNVWDRLENDIRDDKITFIEKSDLERMGMWGLFQEIMEEYDIVMDSGENYAYALGKTLGCNVLTTDDTKPWGPHDLLMKAVVTDIVPLAFYELCYLEFLKHDDVTPKELFDKCKKVNKAAFSKPMNLKRRMENTLRRFGTSITKKDSEFLSEYLLEKHGSKNINDSALDSYIKQHF